MDDYYQKEEQQLPANTRGVVLSVLSELQRAYVVVALARFDCTTTTKMGRKKVAVMNVIVPSALLCLGSSCYCFF